MHLGHDGYAVRLTPESELHPMALLTTLAVAAVTLEDSAQFPSRHSPGPGWVS
jgi:hypothetical protein